MDRITRLKIEMLTKRSLKKYFLLLFDFNFKKYYKDCLDHMGLVPPGFHDLQKNNLRTVCLAIFLDIHNDTPILLQNRVQIEVVTLL